MYTDETMGTDGLGEDSNGQGMSSQNGEFQDRTLICKECGNEFIFSVGEQQFFAEKGFTNEPQRCKRCRDQRKSDRGQKREMYSATCANCGNEAKVPFMPREDRPVYCSECYASMGGAQQRG